MAFDERDLMTSGGGGADRSRRERPWGCLLRPAGPGGGGEPPFVTQRPRTSSLVHTPTPRTCGGVGLEARGARPWSASAVQATQMPPPTRPPPVPLTPGGAEGEGRLGQPHIPRGGGGVQAGRPGSDEGGGGKKRPKSPPAPSVALVSDSPAGMCRGRGWWVTVNPQVGEGGSSGHTHKGPAVGEGPGREPLHLGPTHTH